MKIIVTTKDGERAVEAAEINIGSGDERFAAHRSVDSVIDGFAWAVTHISTGFRLAGGFCVQEAIEKARVEWVAKTPGQRAAALEHARSIRASRQRQALAGVMS
jgi:hypothetical protein